MSADRKTWAEMTPEERQAILDKVSANLTATLGVPVVATIGSPPDPKK